MGQNMEGTCRKDRMGVTKRFAFMLLVWTVCLLAATGVRAETKKLSRVIHLRADKVTEHSITLKWQSVDGAKGYEIRCLNTKTGQAKTIKISGSKAKAKSGKVTYKVRKLALRNRYKFTVTAYAGKKKGKASKVLSVKTNLYKPGKVTAELVSDKEGSVEISWNTAENADYYEVWQVSGDKKTRLKKTTKTSWKSADLKEGKTYKLFVQGVRKSEGETRHGDRSWLSVTPKGYTYYKSLANMVDDGDVYNGGGNAGLVYSREQAEAYVNYGYGDALRFPSSTNYLVWINRRSFRLFLFYRSAYGTDWKLMNSWPCILGSSAHKTVGGIYTLSQSEIYHSYGSNHAEYLSSYSGANAIHSLLYPSQSDSLSAGYLASNGCVRVVRAAAKFIYENCAGSTCVIH